MVSNNKLIQAILHPLAMQILNDLRTALAKILQYYLLRTTSLRIGTKLKFEAGGTYS